MCMITHLESPDPGTTYLSTLVQGDDGKLTMKKTEPMDWSAYDGLWVRLFSLFLFVPLFSIH